jgi:iron complex transport system substrate-binding protein
MRKWWLLLAALAAWIALGRITLGPDPAEAQTVIASTSQPQRIVSMAPDVTEILYTLGLEQNVAAVTSDSDYPPAAAGKPKAGTFWQPNVEAIIAVKPDLVLAQAFEQHRTLVQRLRRMGYPCLTLNIERLDDLFTAIETIGRSTGQSGAAVDLKARLQERLRRLQTLLAGREKVKVLWVVQREPLRIAGLDTFVNGIIELAGGQNMIGPTLHKYPPIGAEQVIVSGVEAIIEPMMLGGDATAQQRSAEVFWSRFANVPAVAGHRIYVVNGDIVSRLSPRIIDGIETIAKCLHPEAFVHIE